MPTVMTVQASPTRTTKSTVNMLHNESRPDEEPQWTEFTKAYRVLNVCFQLLSTVILHTFTVEIAIPHTVFGTRSAGGRNSRPPNMGMRDDTTIDIECLMDVCHSGTLCAYVTRFN